MKLPNKRSANQFLNHLLNQQKKKLFMKKNGLKKKMDVVMML
jgi:hypothetical protein